MPSEVPPDTRPGEADDAITRASLRELFEEFGASARTFKKVVSLFIAEADKAMRLINAAAATLDLPSVARGAHQIRGLAANFRALALQEISGQLEDSAREGTVSDPRGHAAQINHESGRVLVILRSEVSFKAAL